VKRPPISGLTREQLLARWPALLVRDDPAEIQDSEIHAYAVHPSGEFEAVVNSAGHVVDTVFVHRESPLLSGLVSFSASPADVRRRFGIPSVSGEETDIKALGRKGAWERFDYPDWSLHLHYVVGGDRLELVTFMSAQVAARLTR
jgi:hypothetical protein